MITLDQPDDGQRDRRRKWLLALLLLLLFLAAVGIFTLLITRGGAPRAGLPGALGGGSKAFSFDRTLTDVSKPLGITLSPDGKKLFVAEGDGAYAVQVFDTKGNKLGELTPPHSTEQTRQPANIAIAPDGAVYVVERRFAAVVVYNPDGTYR